MVVKTGLFIEPCCHMQLAKADPIFILCFVGKVSVRIAAENGVRLVIEFASSEQVGNFIMELKKAINSKIYLQ